MPSFRLALLSTLLALLRHPVLSAPLLSSRHRYLIGEEKAETPNEASTNNKAFQICDIAGGVAVARDASRSIQTLFLNALEDVEQMREFLTENMKHNGNSVTTTLDDLAQSLDHEARGLPNNVTTLDVGLAWADDRPDRRVERIVGLLEEPPVGNKSADLAMVDLLSGMLPWVVDRRSKEDFWWKDHLSGRSQGPAKPQLFFDQLYLAAYAVTWGNAAAYYPPMTAFVPAGVAFNLHDVLGPHASFRNDSAVQPVLPENNPHQRAVIGKPYADRANPGMSIVSALAPITYTGSWHGFDNYNNTNLGLTAIDISIPSMSKLLHRLDGKVADKNSFGLVVDADFNVYIITQEAVNLIYPTRTGWEESRVHRDEAGFGEIVDDRRNQTYLVSDTILQPLTNLTNADWIDLHQEINQHPPGYRGATELDIVLTGNNNRTTYYVMYDKWSTVGNLTMLVFAPKHEVNTAIDCDFEQSELELETTLPVGRLASANATVTMREEVVFENKGLLDVAVRLGNVPRWIQLEEDGPFEDRDQRVHLAAGEKLVLPCTVTTNGLPVGLTSSLLTLFVQDDDYPDCFYSQVYSVTMSIQVRTQQDLQQLNSFRIFGFIIGGIVLMTSIGCSIWVILHADNPIVKASQPIFLHMLSFGTFVLGTSIIPLSIDDSLVSADGCDVACVAFPWLFCFGFSITFAAIFSKVWRIQRLLEAAASLQRRAITAQDVIIPFCTIFTLNVGLLLALTIVDSLEWNRVEEKEGQSSHGTCWSDLSGSQITFLALLTAVNLLALVMANIQAYRAREIADEFSESRYIFLANFGMLQVMMIGTPVMFLVTENPRAFSFVLSSLVFSIAWPLQLLIFVPKFLFVWSHNHQDADSRVAAAVRKTTSSRFLKKGSSELKSGTSGFLANTRSRRSPPVSSKGSGTDLDSAPLFTR